MDRARVSPWIIALAVGCTRSANVSDAPPAPPPALAAQPPAEDAWTARTQDGAVAVAQLGVAPAPCTLEARRDGRTIWSAPRCLASPGQPVFVGSDGETIVVLERFVPRGAGPGRTGPVLRVTRRGDPVRGFHVGELAPGERAAFSDPWLAPADRGPEQAPRLSDDGQSVRLVTAGGAVVVLGFARLGAMEENVAAQASDQATYRWEDAGGDVHYSLASEIPPDRARTAQRVTAAVGRASVDPQGPRPFVAPGEPRPVVPAPPPPPPPPPPSPPPKSRTYADLLNQATGLPQVDPPRVPGTDPNLPVIRWPGPQTFDAGAMDRQYQQQTKDMKCRTVDGVVICG